MEYGVWSCKLVTSLLYAEISKARSIAEPIDARSQQRNNEQDEASVLLARSARTSTGNRFSIETSTFQCFVPGVNVAILVSRLRKTWFPTCHSLLSVDIAIIRVHLRPRNNAFHTQPRWIFFVRAYPSAIDFPRSITANVREAYDGKWYENRARKKKGDVFDVFLNL